MPKRDLYMEKYYLNEFKEYLIENDKSIRTLNNYVDNVILFIEYFEQMETDKFDPKIITAIDIQDYRSYCQNNLRLGVASVNIRIASLKAYFSYLYLEKIIEKDPSSKIRKIKDTRPKEPKAFDEKTFRALRRLYYRHGNPLHILIMELLSKCGLRASELISLTLEDISMNMDQNIDTPRAGEILIRGGKGNKTRSIPLHKDVRNAIINWLKIRSCKKVDSPYLLISERKDRFTTNGIYRIVMGYHQKLQLDTHYTVHSYRHYFCKQLLKVTDISTVASLAGHSSITTTQLYTIPDKKALEDAISKI
ncbi:tyrosine-type recombinase/integrase [uncultured Clostridium sp.]|uniref:tyrosine-type recombinase/integrase n=1 Tax=uncultured Clostridium sp. TaxID=59620 RepID=UPI00258A1693|nr:tyrosine-type recombinase/integrase [uncultured Clostridium sp.]MDU1350586.1 tyrosine-type recombinase/integrase [Clostridium argentinense]